MLLSTGTVNEQGFIFPDGMQHCQKIHLQAIRHFLQHSCQMHHFRPRKSFFYQIMRNFKRF